ncbi:MAG: alginate export family protein [Pseudomonadales bacterium]|nr:alginate export family protein [Pseudomonadales bacterium]
MSSTNAVAAESAGSSDWDSFIKDGKASLSFRYRFEHVDDNRFSDDADASTVRTRLSIASGRVKGFQLFTEFDNVSQIGADDYNAGGGNTPSMGGYPVIADPEGSELNQLYLDYKAGNFGARVGRQRINLDNQRFVGGVGWRQNEQTYDAVKFEYTGDGFDARYAYINKVRRILGDQVSAGIHDQDGTHLLNAGVDLGSVGRLAAYYYRLDNEDAFAFSTSTFGARFKGSVALGDDVKIRYEGEFARQTDAGDNPADYDANYTHLNGGVIVGKVDVGVGWEALGGDEDDPGEAFRTPFATLHAFNGFADQFLATPDAGLEDRYVKVKFTPDAWIAEARYHSFEADDGSEEFGEELNLRLGYKFNKWVRADAFYADFDGDGSRPDVDKFWLMVSVAF